MGQDDVHHRIDALLDADDSTVNTSAEQLGLAPSTTTLTATALRSALETMVMDAALEARYGRHPAARPSLADVALALAEQDGSPLAGRRDLIEAAATEVRRRHPNADADDVLLWVEAQQALSA